MTLMWEWFLYDLEMKTPEQNNFKTSYKKNKRDLERQSKEVTRMIQISK